MTYREEVSDGISLVAWLDETGYYEGGVKVRDLTAREVARVAAGSARAAREAANVVACSALADALALADLYPAPTPEETALIDAQVVAALSSYRALDNPPADVVSLAAAVVAWRTEVAL